MLDIKLNATVINIDRSSRYKVQIYKQTKTTMTGNQ